MDEARQRHLRVADRPSEPDQGVLPLVGVEVRVEGKLEVRQVVARDSLAVTGYVAGSAPKCSVSFALKGERPCWDSTIAHSETRRNASANS
jgi:hypothetical protein